MNTKRWIPWNPSLGFVVRPYSIKGRDFPSRLQSQNSFSALLPQRELTPDSTATQSTRCSNSVCSTTYSSNNINGKQVLFLLISLLLFVYCFCIMYFDLIAHFDVSHYCIGSLCYCTCDVTELYRHSFYIVFLHTFAVLANFFDSIGRVGHEPFALQTFCKTRQTYTFWGVPWGTKSSCIHDDGRSISLT